MSNSTAGKTAIKVIGATVLALAGILGSVGLKLSGAVSEPTLIVFVGFSLAVGLFVAYSDRIEYFSLKNLDLKLREIRQAEASVKEVAGTLLDVIEKKSHGLMLQSYDAKAADEAIERLKKLIA
jgi:hypothetical protein